VSSKRCGAGGLRVGVTGHRVLAEVPRIRAGVRQGLRAIQAAYPGRSLTVLSSLAEGADRLVVHEVLRTPDASLIVVLPLPPEQYVRDFSGPGSQREFRSLLGLAAETQILPSAVGSIRERAYAVAGEVVLGMCDVLLAVWDGNEQQGLGGTAAVVERARELGKPLVVVRAGNRRRGTAQPTSRGSDQGRVMIERLGATRTG
jgi:hypothetical protein